MKHNRKIIYLAGFLFSLPVALTAYISSSFISQFVSEKLTGIVYALGSATSILALLLAPKIFRKEGGYRFLILIVLLDALSLFALTLVNSIFTVVAVFVLYTSLNTLIIFALDELLKIFSRDSAMGKTRGAYLALSNLAWVVAQLASGTVLGGFSFREIYFISSGIMLLFLLISFLSLSKIMDPQYDRTKATKYVGKFFKNITLFRAYFISFLLQFFYCWMIVYTPIYLYSHLHFAWQEIGIIFTIMLLPFLVLPFHLGKYGDKIGERKMLMSGFAIMAIATLSLFFIKEHVIWIWATLLLLTRVGAATVEVMSDSYFFKHIKPENEEMVGVYRSAQPVAYILGPIAAFVVLELTPSFNYIYVVLTAFMLFGTYLSSTISRNDI